MGSTVYEREISSGDWANTKHCKIALCPSSALPCLEVSIENWYDASRSKNLSFPDKRGLSYILETRLLFVLPLNHVTIGHSLTKLPFSLPSILLLFCYFISFLY